MISSNQRALIHEILSNAWISSKHRKAIIALLTAYDGVVDELCTWRLRIDEAGETIEALEQRAETAEAAESEVKRLIDKIDQMTQDFETQEFGRS